MNVEADLISAQLRVGNVAGTRWEWMGLEFSTRLQVATDSKIPKSESKKLF